LAVWSTIRYVFPPDLTNWAVSDSSLAKLVAVALVARELASSTAVSRAVLKGDEGASESSSSLITAVEDGIEG
jgi:hypothetical protein